MTTMRDPEVRGYSEIAMKLLVTRARDAFEPTAEINVIAAHTRELRQFTQDVISRLASYSELGPGWQEILSRGKALLGR